MEQGTILVIEDEPILGDILLQKLKGAGYTAELARDGNAGIEALRRLKPSLLILDAFIPFLNGFEILQKKSTEPEIKDIPVIMLTNSFDPSEKTNLGALGVSKFLIKADVTPEQVVAEVHLMLEKEIDDQISSGAPAAAAAAGSLKGKKVLLVEDDEFLGKILSTRLADEGIEVAYKTTGESALEWLADGVPDIALLDILLPGINGFEVLDHLRANDKTKATPVIMVSNFNQEEDKNKAFEKGATYLVKATVNPDDIVAELQKRLAH